MQELEVEDVLEEGDSKRLTVAADVRQPDGRVTPRVLQVTMQRHGDRWVITDVRSGSDR